MMMITALEFESLQLIMGNSHNNSPTRQTCGSWTSPACCTVEASPMRCSEERYDECRPLYTQGPRHPPAKKPLFFHTQSTGWQGTTTCESLERKPASRNSGAYNTHSMRSPFPNLKRREGSEHAPARYVGVPTSSNEVYYNVSSQTKRGRRASLKQDRKHPSADTTFAS